MGLAVRCRQGIAWQCPERRVPLQCPPTLTSAEVNHLLQIVDRIDLTQHQRGGARVLIQQAHGARGVMSGGLGKKLGLVVTSVAQDGRGRVYRIIKTQFKKESLGSFLGALWATSWWTVVRMVRLSYWWFLDKLSSDPLSDNAYSHVV